MYKGAKRPSYTYSRPVPARSFRLALALADLVTLSLEPLVGNGEAGEAWLLIFQPGIDKFVQV